MGSGDSVAHGDRHRRHERLEALERLVANVGEHLFSVEVRDGVARDVFTGTGAARLLGGPLPPDADAHALWIEAMVPDDRAGFLAAVEERGRGVANEVTYRLRGFDGRVRWVLDRGYPSVTPDGAVIIDGVAVDITEMRRLSAQLDDARREAERRSRIDALTEVFNRRHFSEVLAAELARSTRSPSRLGVILLDVDHFKRINDTYGHQAGDVVLVSLTRRLMSTVREFDCVARYGGEEFAILAPDVRTDELRALAERLCAVVRDEPFALPDGRRLPVTASLGAARAVDGRAAAVLDGADRALYAAKRRGRDRACVVDDLVDDDLAVEEPETMRLARALSLSASLRERMPEGHDEEVALLAARAADVLGLSPDAVLRCRLGGLLHDIGKIAIPDAVLARQGHLDPADQQVLETHAAIGEQLVRRVPGLAVAALAVRHHHERFDGRGYPDGLAGESIPIEARVVAVADAYSSLRQPAGRRPGRTHEHALDALREGEGSRFDPRVVSAIVRAAGAPVDRAA